MSDTRTYGRMISRTSRELARANMTADIKDAIGTAVDYYRMDRFWFNEEEATAQMTVGVDVYDLPTDYLALDELHLEDTAGQKYRLDPVDFEEMQSIDTQNTAFPEVYSVYRNQLYVRPRTNRALVLRMNYIKEIELSASSTATLSNAWTTDAEEMIRCHAKAEIYEHTLHNSNRAAVMASRAQRAWSRLRSQTISFIDTTRLRKTTF